MKRIHCFNNRHPITIVALLFALMILVHIIVKEAEKLPVVEINVERKLATAFVHSLPRLSIANNG